MTSINRELVSIKYPDRFYIDGAWVSPHSNDKIKVINPATEGLYATVAEATEHDVDRAVLAARSAFDDGPWPRMSHVERANYLRAAADALERRLPEARNVWSQEIGIVHAQTEGMLGALPSTLRYYADLSDTFPFIEPAFAQDRDRNGFIVREPVGVAALIVPWNAPLHLIVYKMAPALIAGCTVIVKNSPETPIEGYLMAEIMEEIGLPNGVFNMITANREVSESLVRHHGVDKVSFTGSTVAGKKIASICSERVARVTLELGGKSAAVVLDDYDVWDVAQKIAQSTCFISNQVCSSLSRVIVSKTRHNQMVEALSAAFSNIRMGDPFSSETDMGPLATIHQRSRVEDFIARGISQGATLAAGGQRPLHLDRGYYVEPTVFAHVDPSSVIAQEEIFGPVVTISAFDNEEEAVKIANGTVFGLNSAIFTNDLQRAYSFARRLEAGTVGHNSFQTDFGIAFGGFKQSGIGREGGTEGLLPYLETKTLIMEGVPDFSK